MLSFLRTLRWFGLATGFWVLLTTLPTGMAWANPGDADKRPLVGNVRTLVEVEERSEQLLHDTEKALAKDPLDRSTPLRSLINVRNALQHKDYELAAKFLDMRYLPEDIDPASGPTLIRQFRYIWSRNNILDFTSISDDPLGHKNDGLPSYRDLLTTIDSPKGPIPIYYQRIPSSGGNHIWVFSNATVSEIPYLWSQYGYTEWTAKIATFLPEFSLIGMENWQVFYGVLIVLLTWPALTLALKLVMAIFNLLPERHRVPWQMFLGWPIHAFLYIVIIRELLGHIGLSIRHLILLDSIFGFHLAAVFIILGAINLFAHYRYQALERNGRSFAIALLRPILAFCKVIVTIVIALMWAEHAGYNMSTVLTGLGVSGVAVALAAQKTLENIIGAITIYIARPVKPGDFCRFGNIKGVVEEIGLRSTLIRTLDRSLVSIPNAVFASAEVENYSARDVIRFNRNIPLDPTASADQMRYTIAEVRRCLLSHPMIRQANASVRFDLVEHNLLQLRIDAHVTTTNFEEYLSVAEDINLRLLEILNTCGISVARPTQRVELYQGSAANVQAQADAASIIEQWRQEDSLPFPDFDAAVKTELQASAQFPPAGSQLQRSRANPDSLGDDSTDQR